MNKREFGSVFCTSMYIQKYEQGKWGEGRTSPTSPFSLHPGSLIFHYGQSIFEGAKAFLRPDGAFNLFRIDRNIERFNRSATRQAMPQIPPSVQRQAIIRTVLSNADQMPMDEGSTLYIRPTMIAVEPSLMVRPSESYLYFIVLCPTGPYFSGSAASIMVEERFSRAARGGSGEAKAGGNYASSLLARSNAKRLGCDEVLWLDSVEHRYVEEVGSSNVAFVYDDGTIRTPALTGSILPGITRASIISLASDTDGVAIEECRLEIDGVASDIRTGRIVEAFSMGTAAAVTPIGRLLYRDEFLDLSRGEPGPVTETLRNKLLQIQYGRAVDPYGWTTRLDRKESQGGESESSA